MTGVLWNIINCDTYFVFKFKKDKFSLLSVMGLVVVISLLNNSKLMFVYNDIVHCTYFGQNNKPRSKDIFTVNDRKEYCKFRWMLVHSRNNNVHINWMKKKIVGWINETIFLTPHIVIWNLQKKNVWIKTPIPTCNYCHYRFSKTDKKPPLSISFTLCL